MRPFWVASLLSMLPEPEMVHDGNKNWNRECTVAGYRERKANVCAAQEVGGSVDLKGTVLVPVPSTGIFG